MIADDTGVDLAGRRDGRRDHRGLGRRPTSCSRRRTGIRSRWRAPRGGTSCPARRAGASSAASTRRSAPVAVERAVELLTQYAGGKADARVLDIDTVAPREPIASPADRPSTWPASLPGQARHRAAHGDRRESRRPARDMLTVTPPTWRPDLTDPADLVEEVIRLDGYDKVPSVLPIAPPGNGLTPRSAGAARWAGRWPRPGTSRCSPTRSSARDAADALGLPADDPRRRGGPRWPTRSRRRSRCCAPRCCRRCSRRCAATSAAAPRRRAVRAGAGLPAGGRGGVPPAMRVCTGARPTRSSPPPTRTLPRQPWHVAVVLAGDVEPAGWWGAGRAGRLGRRGRGGPGRLRRGAASTSSVRAGGTGAVAPGPVRRDRRRTARSWATPASCTRRVRGARSAQAHLRDGAQPRRAAAAGRHAGARRSRRSRPR